MKTKLIDYILGGLFAAAAGALLAAVYLYRTGAL